MKNFLFSFIFFAIISNSFGQIYFGNPKLCNSNDIRHIGILNISGSIESGNYYIAGTTMDLQFTLNLNSPDEEYADQVTMIFPDGVTPNSAVDPFPGNTNSQTTPEALSIDGQKVIWGDNDNNFGGITAPGSYSFYVNVTIDTDIVDIVNINYIVSGDEYNGSIHEFNGTVSVKPLPETAELVTSLIGYIAEYYQVPLRQAVFDPTVKITNNGSVLNDTVTFYANTDSGYADSAIINQPLNTNESISFDLLEFHTNQKANVEFSFSNNFTKDANPDVKPLTKKINIDNILARDNGIITNNIGTNTQGSEIGQIFTITRQDTLTSVQFALSSNSTVGDELSLKVRTYENGVIGEEIGKSLPFKVVEDTMYQIDIFPPVILPAGKYFIGLVEGEKYLGLSITSTPFVEHTAWAYINDKWNDVGELGFNHTYYIRAVFDNYKEIKNDVKLVSIITKDGFDKGDIDIEGTIRNLSNVNVLNSFDVAYSVDGGDKVSYTVSGLSLAPGETYNFKHATPYHASQTGYHELQVSISKPNGNDDETIDNNTLTKNIFVVDEVYPKVVVGEEATGTWCGWCVRGHIALKDMEHYYPAEEWIGIAVHNRDPMANTEYDGKISDMVGQSYPSGVINREAVVDPSEFEEVFKKIKDDVPVAKIEISKATIEKESRNISVEASTVSALDINNVKYRLSMIVVENGVTGTSEGYNQANYYAQLNTSILDWEGIDWSKLGNPIPASKMVYNHVGRYIVGGWNGVPSSVPSSLQYGNNNEYTFISELPGSYDENNINVVVLLLDNETGKILNATEKHLEVTTGTMSVQNSDEINIYPNPATDFVMVKAKKESKINIYNTNGQLVLKTKMSEDIENIDLSNLAKGSYFIEISDDKKVYSKRIILTR